ncbi:MAG: HAD hydrolase family protein [Selenomonadaceae bacterium]|nr:HAD hydrolase family protein [Selenomonadaceae bacterium]
MRILFACDLDNTLIHSYKNRRAGDICVEHYDGHEQSFISPVALDLLKEIAARIIFIPITTRSIEQYRRIFWREDFRPTSAIVANGAYLLNGDTKENFMTDIIAPHATELSAQCEKFSADDNFNICRIVDESFLFLRARDDINVEEISADLQTQTKLTVRHTGRKIYLFPPKLTKGAALNRLTEKFSPDKVIAAGDSDIDLPMLKIADVAFAPKNLSAPNVIKCSPTPDFAEEFLSKIIRLLED